MPSNPLGKRPVTLPILVVATGQGILFASLPCVFRNFLFLWDYDCSPIKRMVWDGPTVPWIQPTGLPVLSLISQELPSPLDPSCLKWKRRRIQLRDLLPCLYRLFPQFSLETPLCHEEPCRPEPLLALSSSASASFARFCLGTLRLPLRFLAFRAEELPHLVRIFFFVFLPFFRVFPSHFSAGSSLQSGKLFYTPSLSTRPPSPIQGSFCFSVQTLTLPRPNVGLFCSFLFHPQVSCATNV